MGNTRAVGWWVADRWASIDHAHGQLGGHTQTRPCGEEGRRVAARWASIDQALVAREWTRRVDPMLAQIGASRYVGCGAGILKDPMLAQIWAGR